MNNYIFKEIHSSVKDKFPYIESQEIYEISNKYYNRYFSENVIPSKESLEKLCKDGLSKITKNKIVTDSSWRDDIEKIKNSTSDKEVKKIIDREIRKKFSAKNLPEDFVIGCYESGWITYALNRQAGRGKVVSYILAWAVIVRFLYWKIFKQNKLSKLTSYIEKTIKQPILFTLGSSLINLVVNLIPFLLGYATITTTPYSLPVTGTLAGLTLTSIGAVSILQAMYKFMMQTLFELNKTRSTASTGVVDVDLSEGLSDRYYNIRQKLGSMGGYYNPFNFQYHNAEKNFYDLTPGLSGDASGPLMPSALPQSLYAANYAVFWPLIRLYGSDLVSAYIRQPENLKRTNPRTYNLINRTVHTATAARNKLGQLKQQYKTKLSNLMPPTTNSNGLAPAI
jgi:hypothetical protein